MKKLLIAGLLSAGMAVAGTGLAPNASATELMFRDVDVFGHKVPVLSWSDPNKPRNWSYKTGYNISPRYTFRTDENGKRHANYDCGC